MPPWRTRINFRCLVRAILLTSEAMSAADAEATMAVFLDLENIALGAHDAQFPAFDVRKVLERLLLKGHIVVKKAYCDFERYKAFKRGLHEAAFEMIEIPHVRQSGKIPPTSAWWSMRSTFVTPRVTSTPLPSSAATPISRRS